MPKPVKDKNGRWRVNFRFKGQRYRCIFPGRVAAENYIRKVLTGKDTKPVSPGNLDQLIRDYHLWSEKIRGKSRSTMTSQGIYLRIFKQWANQAGISDISDFDISAGRGFQAYYFQNAPFFRKPNHRSVSADHRASWNKTRDAVSALLSWCVDRDIIEKNPLRASEFKAKINRAAIRIITKEELAEIFDFLEGQSRIILIFFKSLLYTGLRRNELINLKWEDVNLDLQKITVRKTKTGHPRTIPIPARLMPYFLELRTRQNTYVFDGGDNTPIYAVNRYWKILRQATGIKGLRNIRLHDFRHTYAANLAMANVPIGAIKNLLGHTNIQQTMVYVDFYPEIYQEAADRLNFEGI